MNAQPPWPSHFEVNGDKIKLYLLNLDHRRGASKARFFIGWGFDPGREAEFAGAILAHTKHARLTGLLKIKYGWRYVFEGPLEAPNGLTPPVRSIWQMDEGSTIGLLVSAYPTS